MFEETSKCLRVHDIYSGAETQAVDLEVGVLDFVLYTPPGSDVETKIIALGANGRQHILPFDNATKSIVENAAEVHQVDSPSEVGFMTSHGSVVASTLGKHISIVNFANPHHKSQGIRKYMN